MFELAARLVGVYKVNHMTKSVTIENRDYVVRATAQGQQQQQQGQQGHHGQGQGQGGQLTGQHPGQGRGLQQQVRDSVLPLRPPRGR